MTEQSEHSNGGVCASSIQPARNGGLCGHGGVGGVGEAEGDPVHTQIIQEDNPFVEHGQSYVAPHSGGGRTSSGSSSSASLQEGLLAPPLAKSSAGEQGRVRILEASKVSEGQGRSYITYTISYRDRVVRRRYSEFESLRKILIKLFPMTLIPPIPEKQSLTSYGKSIAGSNANYVLPSEAAGCDLAVSVINGSVNLNDQKMIRHRIRMLTSFLNRLLQNEEVTKTSIIGDFLDPNNANWNDVITTSATISSLPKSVLQCNPLDPTNTTPAHASLPIPPLSSAPQLMGKDGVGTSTKPSAEDMEFSRIEYEYKKYEQLLHTGVYKYNRRITRTMHELKQDLADLSEAFAEFAVEQSKGGDLAELLSYLSNANDEAAAVLDDLVGKIYYNINEPLSEAVHIAGAARELIQYRRLKFAQRDMLKKSLLGKEGHLKRLQEQEDDAKAIDQLVDQHLGEGTRINLQRPSEASPNTYKRKLFSRFNKLANIVKETVTYQEQDPKVNIKTVQEDIEQIKESLDVSASDLDVITATIRDVQLPAFSRNRDKELYDILKNYSKYMKEYAAKNLEIWKDLRKQEENA
ncbi:ADL293Wp [Eremothecium gossypii ATCC 10895]|uniref:Autophagy-related protein 20 n=1 Tax=Eremothecium gossypii (strain ATCC 10895 / CBS 109.51 / FGSC 9923 / NRRL Y-1056) TaxID=284811 RepID=ATG20_EREGS|nr:ADL293Wp [Eremothecium gossypii ATCC 10895]Q75B65.1 RecName: Full=Autophagy-related protein 20 [Eremothecium gossypii ATCC 10895]AAS51627.1 ADL293Wp [Eremothecium gossypii ATCC 10895]AEY95923.1 FADL293Wp [Eremothecium gossypii FDAG1]